MKGNRYHHIITVLLILFGIFGTLASASLILPEKNTESEAGGQFQAKMVSLPLSFIENKGQAPDNILYHVATAGHTISFARDVVVLRTSWENNGDPISSEVQMKFAGASESPLLTGINPLPGKANFLLGNDASQWETDVPTFSAVQYKQLYPGIDLIFSGTEGVLKRKIMVQPGADPNQIAFSYTGIDSLLLAEDGSLTITTPLGVITDEAPIAWQEIGGREIPVTVSYRILGDSLAGFTLGTYDPSVPLIIDPTLKYSTYLTGSNGSNFKAITIDSDGNAYVTGLTISTDFPLMNPLYGNNGGLQDIIVAKINPSGSTLLFSTYIGGSLGDWGSGIAIDPLRNIYVTGYTQSSNFPTGNSLKSAINGTQDIFVLKLNPEGSAFVYSTYLGGNETGNSEYGKGIAADSDGNAYISGITNANNFPVINASQSVRSGNIDTFVSKISPDGSSYVYSTYLGGSLDDGTSGVVPEIVVDAEGNAYVAGWTKSSANFPILNAYQSSWGGGTYDGFITKYNSTGSVIFSTYLGGSGTDRIADIAIDSSRNIYVTGVSGSANYPTVNPIQAAPIGSTINGIVTKMAASGQSLIYSTFWGNGGTDNGGKAIAVDPEGDAFILGDTSSSTFPMVNPIQATNRGGTDYYIYKINPGGTAVLYSTYLGSTGNDVDGGIAVDSAGNAYIAGGAGKANFPLKDPLMTYSGTNGPGIIAMISPLTVPVANFTAAPLTGPYPLTVQFTDLSTNGPTSWDWQFGDGTPNSTDQSPSHIYTAAGNYTVSLTAINGAGSHTVTKTNYINVTIPVPVLSVVPNATAIPIGSTTQYQLVVNTLPAGLAGFNLTVSLDNPAAGEIMAFSPPSWAALNGSTALPADSLTFNGVDLNLQVQPGATNVPLGTITVRADAPGITGINVTVQKMDADGGARVSPVIVNGSLAAYQPLTANFTATPLAGTRPLMVTFTDLSTGDPLPTTWAWDFNNDGVVDNTTKNPEYNYTAFGHYSVNLTVANAYDSDSMTRISYIWVKHYVMPFPGYTNDPTDPDGDDLYEDINGNGRLDFDDVVAYYWNMAWIENNTEVGIAPYDYNGNGRIDYDDVVVLYYEVLGG